MFELNRRQVKKNVPTFRPGDTVCVSSKVKEGEKERIQAFEGVVISRKGSAATATFTVRKVSYGVGVERIFPLHSPMIEKIEVKQNGMVRRAKLYYLRDLSGRAARIEGTIAEAQIFEDEILPEVAAETPAEKTEAPKA